MVSIAISNFLILLRLWALWDRDRHLMAWTGLAYFLTQIGNAVALGLTVDSLFQLSAYSPMVHACVLTAKGGLHDAGLWIPGLFFEVAVFISLFLYTIQRAKNFKTVMKTMWHEGMPYIVVLFCIRLLNLISAIISPVRFICSSLIFTTVPRHGTNESWSVAGIAVILRRISNMVCGYNDYQSFHSPLATCSA